MIGIVIQARMGSTRLPGKVLKQIGHKCLLDHILCRLERLRSQAVLVIATSDKSRDDAIADFCSSRGVECFRGSEENVLERYHLCALKYGFSHVVRLTGDNPFPDVEELDRLIALHLDSAADYSFSWHRLPEGTGAEIFSVGCLKKCAAEATQPHHFEHVNDYLLENRDKFTISELEVPPAKQVSGIRLTVDTPDDLERAAFILQHAKSEPIGTLEAVRLAQEFGR